MADIYSREKKITRYAFEDFRGLCTSMQTSCTLKFKVIEDLLDP